MAELVTVARPYAVAAFEHARDHAQLAQWSQMLELMVSVYNDPTLREALANPKLSRADAERMLIAVCGEKIDVNARNLLILLVRNNRLDTLPSIRDLYEQLKAEQENEVEAAIESAFPMQDDQVRTLVQRLEARTRRRVKPHVHVTPELIGGVRVTIGDDVWDGSVRGQLESLKAALVR
ncbi:MAG TPA: F0F1 ATP synthase subunit delta [Burkholderiales bacterium]|nr:F0F1 ATP synthase subunit delta [Burkholderiales bacterium]